MIQSLTPCQSKNEQEDTNMKKNIGSQLALYPTPVTAVANTCVEEGHLNEAVKVNYHILKPVLLEFPAYEYLKTGDVIGKCLSLKTGECI